MHFDATAFLRLDAPGSLGTSAAGASFATSTGDILEATCYGPGVFRLRVGPDTRPDYGLVQGRRKACTVTVANGVTTLTHGDSALEIAGRPLSFRLLHKGAPVFGSITDRQVRRLHAAARVRPAAAGRPLDRGVRARLGGAGLRPRREVRPARQARTADPLAGRGRARRQHRAVVQEHAVRLEHRQRSRRLGHVRRHARATSRTASATRTGRTAATRSSSTTRRSTCSCSPPTRRPRCSTPTRSSPVARPRCRCGASGCGCRAPTTGPRRRRSTSRRRCASGGSPATSSRSTAARCGSVETRFNFRWNPDGLFDVRESLAALKAHHFRVCVGECPYVSVHDPLFAELAARGFLLRNSAGDPLVIGWDATTRGGLPAARPPTLPTPAAAVGNRRLHPSGRLRVVARRPPDAVRRRRRRDQERLRRAGAGRRGGVQRRPRQPAAQRVSAALQPVRVRGDGEVPARPATRRRWCGAARRGRRSSASRWAGAATRRATSRAWPRRSAADCRGG